MPLTNQVIRTIVKEEVKSQLDGTNQKIDNLAKSTNQKIDNLAQMTNQKIDDLSKMTNQKIDNLEQATNQNIDDLAKNTGGKLDHLTTLVVDLAGQFRKFDEEQTVLSGQVSDVTDRVEKLELVIN
jgi:DNA anti-recombination protein RmuC